MKTIILAGLILSLGAGSALAQETSLPAIWPERPWAFSCSSALTSSTVEKNRTRLW